MAPLSNLTLNSPPNPGADVDDLLGHQPAEETAFRGRGARFVAGRCL